MNKHIPCKRCSGRGFINWTFSEGNTGTATSYICPDCNGSGNIVVPMTNADRIRSMTDEELAELLSEPCECSVDPEEDDYRECGNKFCIEYLLNWLKQPAEEDNKNG